MRKSVFGLALLGLATLSCAAKANTEPGAQPGEVALETMFAGIPANTSQHGLRELGADLFLREGLDRESGCLAAALYFEARGESVLGQIAVALVIFNRVRSRAYPGSICDVVWQNSHRRNRCQFSFTCDGKADLVRDRKSWARSKSIARTALCLLSCTRRALSLLERLPARLRRATHYHADYVAPGWSRELERTLQIGRHIFYISARVERQMPVG